MATTAQPTTHFYRFDLREQPGDPMKQFSSSDLNAGEEAFLSRYQFKPMPGGGSPLLSYFSSTFCEDAYLVIGRIGEYRLVFYVHDESSLLEFRRKFEPVASVLPRMVVPPPPSAFNPNLETIQMNPKVRL